MKDDVSIEEWAEAQRRKSQSWFTPKESRDFWHDSPWFQVPMAGVAIVSMGIIFVVSVWSSVLLVEWLVAAIT